MIVTNDNRHPGDAEYLAAAAGLSEQTPSPRAPVPGDFVSGRTAGRTWSGRVEWIEDDGRMVIDVGGAWLAVPVADITH
jgi:hypothetical protein